MNVDALLDALPDATALPPDWQDQLAAAADAAKNGQSSFVLNGQPLTVANVSKYAQPTPSPDSPMPSGGTTAPGPVDTMLASLPDASKPQGNSDTQTFMRGLFTAFPLFGQYTPDVAMGARQVLDSAAQMAARGATKLFPNNATLAAMQSDTENVNQNALNDYQQKFGSLPGSGLMRGAGQALVTAPLTPARAITGGAQLIKALAQGGAQGAAAGVLTPDYSPASDFWQQKAAQAQQGAVAGGATAGLLNFGGRLLSPNVSDQVQTLVDSGVSPTPGQIMGGLAKTTEEKLTSIPVLGDAIKMAQARGLNQFNTAIYQRVLAPFGDEGAAVASAAPVGRAGIATVGDFLSDKYEQALAASVPSVVDGPFQTQTTQLATMVPTSMQQDFVNAIKNNITSQVTPGGTLTPDAAKAAESELGRLASTYRGSSVGAERELGLALTQAQANLRNMVARSNPDVAPIIQNANQGWASLTQLEQAGQMAGAKEGVVSPAQYMAAIRGGDQTIRNRAFARGEANNQDLAEAGSKVLGNVYPDSGTAGRGILGALVGAAATGGLGMVTANPAVAMGGAASMLAYTPWGQKLAAMLLAQRPQIMQGAGNAIRSAVPYLGMPAAAGLLGMQSP